MTSLKLHIQFDDESRETAIVFVEGRVHGEVCRLVLDTGCAKTTLAWNDFTCGLEKVGSQESSGVFGRLKYDVVKVAELSVGPLLKTNVSMSRSGQGQTPFHLLGMDVLKDCILHLKLDEERVEIAVDAKHDFSPIQELFLDRRSIPYIDVVCDEVMASGVWDVGAGVTLVNARFVKDHPSIFDEVGVESGTDSTGATMETSTYVMKSMVIGGKRFAPHKVVALDLTHVNSTIETPMDMILGYSTLKQAHWLFDFPGRKWGVSKMLA